MGKTNREQKERNKERASYPAIQDHSVASYESHGSCYKRDNSNVKKKIIKKEINDELHRLMLVKFKNEVEKHVFVSSYGPGSENGQKTFTE